MEVVNKNIKEQFTKGELEKNYLAVMNQINGIIVKNDWEVIINGVAGDLSSINLDLNNLSLNARKKVARRLYYLNNKQTRRNINILFLQLKKVEVISESVFVPLSRKELDIQVKRKLWLALREEAETALLNYKLEKGNFYKLFK